MQSKEKAPMSEEKRKRIVVAMTAAGVLLVIFLVIILIVQFVQIGVKSSLEDQLTEEAEHYRELQKHDERDLEYYKSEEGLYILALKNGWISPND